MNALRLLAALIVAVAGSLIAFAAFYVRGDLGAVFRYLGARGDARRLAAAGGSPEQLAAAQAQVHALADAAAHPDFAVRTIPLALLLGALAGYGVWRLFGSREHRAEASDVQDRMLLRLAYRQGGRFSIGDLEHSSPLTTEQARAAVRRLEEAGQLRDVGSGLYELV